MQSENFKEDMTRQFMQLCEEVENLKASQIKLQAFLDFLLESELSDPNIIQNLE
jgi:hypothetical protein